MSTPAPVTLIAALVLGLGGSLHCFAMCGPLACAAQGGADHDRRLRAFLYQLFRVLSYSVVGAAFGAIGHAAAGFFSLPIDRALPWLLAAALLASAGLPALVRQRIPAPPGFAQFLRWVARARARMAPTLQAILLGSVTPLLPCGLVYGIALAAAATAHPLDGGLLMGGFALGAVPALVLAQLSQTWLGRQASSRYAWIARGLPVAAALVLILRATFITSAHPCH